MINRENDVILAVLKLSRAMRRCPPDPGKNPFPPAVGRMLECVAENSNVSSRELCELLDVRPSSLSEMMSRAESEGWIIRAVDEEDRRMFSLLNNRTLRSRSSGPPAADLRQASSGFFSVRPGVPDPMELFSCCPPL